MKIPRPFHNWQVTPKQAVAIQRRVALLRKETAPPKPLHYIAGVDAAFSGDGKCCIAGVVLWHTETREVVEERVATAPLRFPYIPGLLTFREGPAVLAALRRLRHRPDALLCDGQGIAHPRRCGIATHIGVITGLPAVGCAKSRLVGEYREPGTKRGDHAPLLDKGQIVGTVLRTRDHVKPVFISVGHNIELAAAEQLILSCGAGFRLPEPTRLADQLVAAAKRQLGAGQGR